MKAGKEFLSQYSHIGKRLAGTKLISKGNVACMSTVSDDNEWKHSGAIKKVFGGIHEIQNRAVPALTT